MQNAKFKIKNCTQRGRGDALERKAGVRSASKSSSRAKTRGELGWLGWLETKGRPEGKKGGQAMIIAILIIFMAAMAIGVAAATVAITQTNVVQNMNLSKQAYNLAESGVDNTIMRMTKGDFLNPGVLSEGAGTCTITVSGSLPSYQILSVAEITSPLGGGKKAFKKIQANVTVTDGVVSIASFQEVY